MSETYYGGVEGGGTKFVCAIGSSDGTIVAQERFQTEDPAVTLANAIGFFRDHPQKVAAIGIGTFGPIELRHNQPNYGWITATPKIAWRNTDVVGPFAKVLNVPVAFDTDVNAAALGEWTFGALKGRDVGIYITVGTGIGGGVIVNGKPLHGLAHPEMGHIHVTHDLARDPYAGHCPYHGDCLEGLASGPALGERYGIAGEALADSHEGFALVAHYVAQALTTFTFAIAPERIVVGGGLGARPGFLELVRNDMRALGGGYPPASLVVDTLEDFVVTPGLDNRSGVLGSIALATTAIA